MTPAARHETGLVARRQPPLVKHMIATVRRRSLFAPGTSVLVAVSGGPDSVGLLHVLHSVAASWRLSLSVVHCNYGLRGQESDDDEAFVRKLCEELRLSCHVRRLSMFPTGRRPGGRSLQERARTLRYEVFRDLAVGGRIDRVALGHTADDQAETILLWMLRGAGSSGLSGMPVMRDGLFVRPLIEATRQEVLAYLANGKFGYRIDSSNRSGVYARNRLRRHVMPALARLNPSVVRVLARQAEILAVDEDFLQSQTAAALAVVAGRNSAGDVVLDRGLLLALPLALQRRVVREAFRRFHESEQAPALRTVTMVLERIFNGRTGARLAFRKLLVVREYDRIVLRATGGSSHETPPAHQPSKLVTDAVTPSSRGRSTLTWAPSGQEVRVRLAPATPHQLMDPQGQERVVLDADRVTPQMWLRAWKPGDWFCPSGMGGHRKKLHDYWIDAKVPRLVRSITPLLVAPEGILWIVGHRPDHRFLPTAKTARVLIAEVTPIRPHATTKER